MRNEVDRQSANPADQATTARERILLSESADAESAEQAQSLDDIASANSTRVADAASRARIDRLRASYMAEHPSASEFDFERDLPTLNDPSD